MFFTAFDLRNLRLFKLKKDGYTIFIYRKPHCKVTKLKSKFLSIPFCLIGL